MEILQSGGVGLRSSAEIIQVPMMLPHASPSGGSGRRIYAPFAGLSSASTVGAAASAEAWRWLPESGGARHNGPRGSPVFPMSADCRRPRQETARTPLVVRRKRFVSPDPAPRPALPGESRPGASRLEREALRQRVCGHRVTPTAMLAVPALPALGPSEFLIEAALGEDGELQMFRSHRSLSACGVAGAQPRVGCLQSARRDARVDVNTDAPAREERA
jgi:hypothetical protein